MTTQKQAIEQGIRAWLIACCVPGETLDDGAVILANQKGPRPLTSYLTVLVSVVGAQLGEDEQRHSLDGGGEGQVRTVGLRFATVSIQGFGEETSDWLEQARLSLPLPAATAILDAVALSVQSASPIQNISALLDTGIEPRYSWDVRADYQIESANQAEPGLEVVGMDEILYEAYDGAPDPLIDEFTLSLP